MIDELLITITDATYAPAVAPEAEPWGKMGGGGGGVCPSSIS